MQFFQGVLRREARWCLILNHGASPAIAAILSVASRLGDGVFWYGLMAALTMVGGDAGRSTALAMLVTGLCTLALYKVVKTRVARPRPCDVLEHMVVRGRVLDRWSFPSGHTMHAVAFTLVASATFPGLLWVLVPFTFLVMLSRVVLGLHYPSDVIAGAMGGWTMAVLCTAGLTLFAG
jgi:undecaprenyl-diphosphatase